MMNYSRNKDVCYTVFRCEQFNLQDSCFVQKSFKRPTNGEASCGVITALESDEEDTGTPTVTFPRLKRRRLNIIEVDIKRRRILPITCTFKELLGYLIF